jgi:uncharacterized protein YdaU (DUF1376 family)
MRERKMHYFEFHFQKFIAATKGWKDDEVGAFLKLLIEQFDRGYIPDDEEELSRLITTFKKNWPRLKKKFTEPSEPGQLRNTFMCAVREEAHEKSVKNAENGAKGGRAKKANAIANGTAFAKRTGKRNGSQPVTSNQEPVTNEDTPKESESVNTRPDLSESNLFRQPNIPIWEDVHRVFIQQGGTEAMAKRFFESNSATGWFLKGSPITNFSNLVPGYVANWKEREDQPTESKPKKMVY